MSPKPTPPTALPIAALLLLVGCGSPQAAPPEGTAPSPSAATQPSAAPTADQPSSPSATAPSPSVEPPSAPTAVADAPDAQAPAPQKGDYGFTYTDDRVSATPPTRTYTGPPTANGRIMADHIRNVVRDAFPQVNACYASGLKKNKDLAGRVTVKFLIGPKGTVQRSSDGGSDLADRTVVQCVVSAMKSLVFPSGASVVTVVYPFMFGP